ncbi:MAG: helix-turn-helix domain-containing protein [Thermosynechococcus sp. Uc]|uniref:RNA-guided endonuclease InsQ/TnpB family protein n=1 Tax=Thermosynechococcus sp. Uc TaxID=3034853 RepID=UPI0019DA022C|nr:helix-turn-helix domain-containing protein [Thermosynechococcus sp. Uc]MDM7326048.1 helix-turn-helix domain-containing protein [Thermosynechococcus sp. Uc]HIK26235.1 helix-turn-helix domain-containing protein [Thermosynechococcus sp. M46_R2017_013]
MRRIQAFKYELMPNGQQERQMRRFTGSCRFVDNKALALQKERYKPGQPTLGYAGLCQLLTAWRHSTDTKWLSEAPVHPPQQSLKDFERAYAHFFAKRAGFPRSKKKGQSDSFCYPDPTQIKLDQANSRLFVPKLGWLRYRNSREVLGTVKNVTLSQSCGKWFVRLVAVLPQHTSRTCPCCGHVSVDKRWTQSQCVCVECGYENNADLVGAINVLRAGHARIACEVSSIALPAAGTHRSDSGAAQCRA